MPHSEKTPIVLVVDDEPIVRSVAVAYWNAKAIPCKLQPMGRKPSSCLQCSRRA